MISFRPPRRRSRIGMRIVRVSTYTPACPAITRLPPPSRLARQLGDQAPDPGRVQRDRVAVGRDLDSLEQQPLLALVLAEAPIVGFCSPGSPRPCVLGSRTRAAAEGPMVRNGRSPRITHLSWGRIEVEGGRTFKDAKLWPGGVREWNWNETGTRHRPGVQPADVEELLQHGAEVVVLSKGILQALQVCPATLELLKSKGIAAHVLQTEVAVRLQRARRGAARCRSLPLDLLRLHSRACLSIWLGTQRNHPCVAVAAAGS
jgi:hypothetical protein